MEKFAPVQSGPAGDITAGLPLTAVLVITDGKQRMKNLAQAVNAARQPILFSTLDVVRTQGLLAPVFNRSGEYEPVRLI